MEDLRPTLGDVWELRVVEFGAYRGIPVEVYRELYPPDRMGPAMPYNFGFGFYTELRYYSRRIISRGTGERDIRRTPGESYADKNRWRSRLRTAGSRQIARLS